MGGSPRSARGDLAERRPVLQLLLHRTPKPQPHEPLNYRKDEYQDPEVGKQASEAGAHLTVVRTICQRSAAGSRMIRTGVGIQARDACSRGAAPIAGGTSSENRCALQLVAAVSTRRADRQRAGPGHRSGGSARVRAAVEPPSTFVIAPGAPMRGDRCGEGWPGVGVALAVPFCGSACGRGDRGLRSVARRMLASAQRLTVSVLSAPNRSGQSLRRAGREGGLWTRSVRLPDRVASAVARPVSHSASLRSPI